MKTLLRFLVASPLAALAAGPIQDNSFLIEEAYNQEEGVVQHISTFQRFRDSRDWAHTFTQEWPVASQKHQFSYTLPLLRVDGERGAGDVALNYRYQLVGDGEAPLAITPRVSVLLPTGDAKKGRGLGATGYQAAIAASLVMTPALVAHSNAGYTWTPHAKDADGNKSDVNQWSVGQSVVWLANPRFNVLVEAVYSRSHDERSSFVSPGIRWSHDFDSGLQIVPGIAFPIGVGSSHGEKSVFFYLSFEHPFKRSRS